MHVGVILFSAVSICLYYNDDINYENLMIYVSGISWSLTIIQGGYFRFWRFILDHIVGKFIEERMQNQLENLKMEGMKDEDGHVITSWDVIKLEEILVAEERSLFICRALEKRSTDSNKKQEKISSTFTKSVMTVSILVGIELAAGLTDWLGFANLYVFIPLLYLYYQVYNLYMSSAVVRPDGSQSKAEYAMELWMTYKEVVEAEQRS